MLPNGLERGNFSPVHSQLFQWGLDWEDSSDSSLGMMVETYEGHAKRKATIDLTTYQHTQLTKGW
jgi:hypothetical protein